VFFNCKRIRFFFEGKRIYFLLFLLFINNQILDMALIFLKRWQKVATDHIPQFEQESLWQKNYIMGVKYIFSLLNLFFLSKRFKFENFIFVPIIFFFYTTHYELIYHTSFSLCQISCSCSCWQWDQYFLFLSDERLNFISTKKCYTTC